MSVTFLITPPPTPNGPLHVGHLSGPYVAGDIAARAARAAGHDVVTMCGFDSHQNYVLARATAEGMTGHEADQHFGGMIRGAMSAARIDYDLFLEPLNDADYRDGVARLLTELVEREAIPVVDTRLAACSGCGRILHHVRVSGTCPVCGQGSGGGTCEGCGSFQTAVTLLDATSTCCQAAPVPVDVRVPVLRLEDYRDALTEVWSRAVVPPRVRALITRYLDNGLPEVPLAYVTDWGIPWQHGDTELRVDVWGEAAIGYLYTIARHVSQSSPRTVADCVSAWSEVDGMWHFFGVDNAFYYAIMIPAMLSAAGMPPGKLAGLVVNEFYRLDGRKFSTSRNHAVWAHEFLAEEDPGTVRAFLSWDRPDRSETDFTHAGYRVFRDRFQQVRRQVTLSAFPAGLAAQELDRAEGALGLPGFDPALAVRCVLGAYPDEPMRAESVLRHITGE